jgi:hypothetical protein
MKKIKFSLPILALIIGIAASAFTVKESSSPKTGNEQSLYWYFVDNSGNLGNQIGTTQQTKSAVMNTIDCDDTDSQDCARGYLTQQSGFGLPAPEVSAEDELIKRTQD